MKIKTKLHLGFGFLFAVVVFFGGVTLFYLNEISKSATVILKDNYETLRYTRDMRTILDENNLPLSKKASDEFGRKLRLEENNITEKGEKEAVVALRKAYSLVANPSILPDQRQEVLRMARSQLRTIEHLNMDAIVRKNDAAQRSVKKATMYLAFAGTFSFLILFSFRLKHENQIAQGIFFKLIFIRDGMLIGYHHDRRTTSNRRPFQINTDLLAIGAYHVMPRPDHKGAARFTKPRLH